MEEIIGTLDEFNDDHPEANRNYKDTVFRKLFSDKPALLHLYNAVNNSSYTDPEQLEITTIGNFLYMGIYNDISFMINCNMYLYEHQSTVNPNIPLRALEYFDKLCGKFIEDKNERLYSRKLQKIPEPKFIVFYNGVEEQPEKRMFRLSDMYIRRSESPALELEVLQLNINAGHNKELLEKCRELNEYTIFVATVRKYMKKTGKAMDRKAAMKRAMRKAVDECIKNNVLRDFLIANRAEVEEMFEQFDMDKYIRFEKEDSYKDGYTEGEKNGINRGRTEGIDIGKNMRDKEILDMLNDGKSIEDIKAVLTAD